MVIWPAFRVGQYRVNDHPYHAPQFISPLETRRLETISYATYNDYYRAELDYYKTHFRRFECSMDKGKIVTVHPSFFEFDKNKVDC